MTTARTTDSIGTAARSDQRAFLASAALSHACSASAPSAPLRLGLKMILRTHSLIFRLCAAHQFFLGSSVNPIRWQRPNNSFKPTPFRRRLIQGLCTRYNQSRRVTRHALAGNNHVLWLAVLLVISINRRNNYVRVLSTNYPIISAIAVLVSRPL